MRPAGGATHSQPHNQHIALFLCPLGTPNSPTRKLADDLFGLIKSALGKDWKVLRPDRESVYGEVLLSALAEWIDLADVIFLLLWDADDTRCPINPNVMYELGLVHLSGKRHIIIHPEPYVEKLKSLPQLPFDVSLYKYVPIKIEQNGGKINLKEIENFKTAIVREVKILTSRNEQIPDVLQKLGGSMRHIFNALVLYINGLQRHGAHRIDASGSKIEKPYYIGSEAGVSYYRNVDLSDAEGDQVYIRNSALYRLDASSSFLKMLVLDNVRAMVVDISNAWNSEEENDNDDNHDEVPAAVVVKDCVIGTLDLSNSRIRYLVLVDSAINILDLSETEGMDILLFNTRVLDSDQSGAGGNKLRSITSSSIESPLSTIHRELTSMIEEEELRSEVFRILDLNLKNENSRRKK